MFKRTWENNLTSGQIQELRDAEAYVSKFGDGNSYASHMILMVRLAKIADALQLKADTAIAFESTFGNGTGHVGDDQ